MPGPHPIQSHYMGMGRGGVQPLKYPHKENSVEEGSWESSAEKRHYNQLVMLPWVPERGRLQHTGLH